MPVVHSAGVPIYYELAGAGAPIVLVHGFAASFESIWGQTGWRDFLIAQERTVVGLDVRGHGQSGKPRDSGAYDMELMAGDVLAVMDAAGVGRADLMGYSMGGRIVLGLVARSPDRFSSAIVGGAGIYATIDPRLRDAVVQALGTDDVSSITDPTALFFRQFAESRAHNSRSLADRNPDLKALAACFASFGAQRDQVVESALRQLQLPLLAVAGDKDQVLAGAQHLVEIVANARLVVLPGEDHLSAITARTYKEAVASFLRPSSAPSV